MHIIFESQGNLFIHVRRPDSCKAFLLQVNRFTGRRLASDKEVQCWELHQGLWVVRLNASCLAFIL